MAKALEGGWTVRVHVQVGEDRAIGLSGWGNKFFRDITPSPQLSQAPASSSRSNLFHVRGPPVKL